MTNCKYIDDYLQQIQSGQKPASKELQQASVYIETVLSDPDVFVDVGKTEKSVELIEKYFDLELFDWEKFVLGLVHCYHKKNDTVVFDEFLIVMGRGNGKNGFISGLSWYLTTPYHGISGYNVDIIANCEDQAKTSFEDIYDALERRWEKLKRFFYKSKELIKNIRTNSYIKYNTSSAKTKDGKRSACLVFDELHEYENSDTIRVFRSGFGKRKHSRIFEITTNGYVRDGVLDDKLQLARDILDGKIKTSGMCPLIYKLDEESEADDPELWIKANPSLPWLPYLRQQIEKDHVDKEYDTTVKLDFYTKRMNLPKSDREIVVTDWENIAVTSREIPDMDGCSCTLGIDFAKIGDFVSTNLHFKRDDWRYDINHSWLCARSADLPRIRAPWREWEHDGLLTVVDDVEIPPEMVCEWIMKMGRRYNIVKAAIDNYRYALLRMHLERIGFDPQQRKNLVLVRPSDIMKVVPVIDSCFNNQRFVWGDNPVLRWAANNTKLVRSGKKDGADTGNYYYAKIEGRSRKTDPFMALVASMIIENALEGAFFEGMPDLGLIF